VTIQPQTDAWVFVSHASAAKVRKVRNFIKDQGGAPILFHLKALRSPEQF
jgi:hypothetical protein